MKISKRPTFFCVLALLMASIFVVAEARTISGQVTAGGDGAPIGGIDVEVVGSDVKTTTDHDGMYSLEAANGAKLRFLVNGRSAQEIMVGDEAKIDVRLGF